MAMDYFLKQINPTNTTPLIICLDTNEVIVGRRSIVSLTGFYKVSRKHACFTNKNGRWFVRDMGSLNKLYVNFKEVNAEPKALEIGDIIGFGTPSYIEDGGLVCVFAAKNRIKQEIFEEIEPADFESKNNEIQNVYNVKDNSFTVKQELSPSKYGNCQQERTFSKPDYTVQIDAPSASSTTLNNIESNNITVSENKYESYSEELKPVIKIEPSENDDNELPSVKNTTSSKNLPINLKLDVANISPYDSIETAATCELKFSLKNDGEDTKRSLNKEDWSSDPRKADVPVTECYTEVDGQIGKNNSIPEDKVLKSCGKLQDMKNARCQKTNDDKYLHNQIKNCSVRLVRCDSKYFQWPSEINFNKLFDCADKQQGFSEHSIAKIFRDEKNIEMNSSEVKQKQNSECHQTPKKFKESIQEVKSNVNVALKLKITKNRIVSSSSEMSSDENESEKKDAEISNSTASDKRRIKMKSKKKTKVGKSRHIRKRKNSSLDETSERLKIPEKRKQCRSENLSAKRRKRTKECENLSGLNEPGKLKLHSSESTSSKKADIRNVKSSYNTRDVSSFYVQNSYCSKYWTPDYDEFETGEIRESLKPNAFIKIKPTAGRTLLTDPKPMEYRPKRMRGREEWFKERCSFSSRISHQTERKPENDNDETSYPSKDSSKSSSGQGFTSLKEHSSIGNRNLSTELSLNQTDASSKGNTLVNNRKNSEQLISSEGIAASRGNIPNVSRKNTVEQFSSGTIAESSGISSIVTQRSSIELSTNQTVASSKGNTSVNNRKNSEQLFSSEGITAPRGNIPTISRKNTVEQISSETIAASSGISSIVTQRSSIETSTNQPSEEKLCMENKDQPTPGNTSLINSTAVMLQKNTTLSIPKRRNSLGCRTRFLVEIQTNADETSKTEESIAKETSLQSSEKQNSISTLIVNATKNITTSTFPVATKTKEEDGISVNNTIASISPNPRIVSLPASNSTSSFEHKNQINSSEREENKISTPKAPDISEILSKLDKINEKTRDMQFLPKEIFSKNDKILNDRKVAVVSPVNHDNLQLSSLNPSDTVSTSYSHTSIKEKITNRVHSTYILSPVKPNSKPILSNSDFTNVEDTTGSISEAKSRSRYLIKSIVHWNPKWLEEQARNKKPPPIVSKGGTVLPLRFSSYDSYLKSFYPMISLEIWESLFRESKPLWLKKEVKNVFYYLVRSNNVQNSLIELQCESVVNENLSFLPSEGNIILLGCSDLEKGLENSLFGYINHHKVESVLDKEKMKEWQIVPKEWQENAKFLTFSVHIKKSKKNFQLGSVNVAYGILNIKNKLQLAEALIGFKDSPIQNDILRPTKEMFSFCKSISRIPRPLLIHTVSEEIKKGNPHSKLILINAPAGTGKTGAIIGIVEKLLFNNACKMKILLCASSDMTVDEIGLRLVELNERCSWRGNFIKFVRLGESENIPAKLQTHTLERKVLKMFKEQNKQIYQEREKELKVLEDKINEVLFKEQLKTNNRYRFRKSNDEALKCLMDQLQTLKEKNPYKNIDPVIHAAYESAILNESDVILATLNSCMHSRLRKFFKSCKDESNSCCIIDEISQCTELEVLQCLHPEIDRLILVGDLQQLQPQVSSKYAIKWGFRRSMMERILKLFTVQFSCLPPLSLAEQHRMQSQICHFPSKYFYKGQLLTASEVDERYQYSPLKPFVVYDILEKEIPNPPVNIEDNEPFIIANICAQLLQTVPAATLGVIVPHENLAALYRIPLSLGNTTLKEIEINTVENYQGVERDIIIISCINPSLFAESENFLSCENMMNVAITRARQSLVICGHVSSMKQFKHWAALINDAQLRKSFISVSSLRQIPFVIMKTICRLG